MDQGIQFLPLPKSDDMERLTQFIKECEKAIYGGYDVRKDADRSVPVARLTSS